MSRVPSFLQREGCLIQAQARTVVKSRKKTSDSRMASSSIVPAASGGFLQMVSEYEVPEAASTRPWLSHLVWG